MMLASEIMSLESTVRTMPAHSPERRRSPRICVPFPTTVRGVDKDGQSFEVKTVLDNFSHTGLYLRIMPCVEEGASLSVTIRMLNPKTGKPEGTSSFQVSEARVVRIDLKPGEVCGVAAVFERSKFV